MMAQFKVTSSTTCPEQEASRLLVFSLVWNSLVKERLSVFLKKNEEKGDVEHKEQHPHSEMGDMRGHRVL